MGKLQNFKDEMKFRFKFMKYTWLHKKAFLKVEKELLGKNTIRGVFHDVDKLILYPIFGIKKSHQFHKKYSKHHYDNVKSKKDKIQLVIDWECARYTKEDKPLTAREYLNKKYPNDNKNIGIILNQLKLY